MGFSSFQGPSILTGSVGIVADPAEYPEDTSSVDGNVGMLILEVRRDVCSSSVGSDGDRAVKNQDADGFSYSTSKSRDASCNAERVLPVTDVTMNRIDTPVSLIAASQNYTSGTWSDLGQEISTAGFTRLALWINHVNNNNTGSLFRALGKHTSVGAEEYSLPLYQVGTDGLVLSSSVDGDVIRFKRDVSQNQILIWTLANVVPYVQFQIQAVTTGSTVGNVATANYTLGWGM